MKSFALLYLVAALAACKSGNDAGKPESAAAVEPPAVTTPIGPSSMPHAVANTNAEAEGVSRLFHYQCGDLLFSVRWRRDAARLWFSGRDITLPQVPAASGAKYDDGKGNTYWNKDGEIILILDGNTHGTCTPSERPSPWVDAQLRSIAFRAVGNEPGWYVEVGRGETPSLHALLDYGERRIDIASVQPLTGTVTGFRGTTTNGTVIELRITHTPCSDGMSGEVFKTSAELRVADNIYTGCGAHLESNHAAERLRLE